MHLGIIVLAAVVAVMTMAVMIRETLGTPKELRIWLNRLGRVLEKELLSTAFGEIWEGLSWVSSIGFLLLSMDVMLIMSDWCGGGLLNHDLFFAAIAVCFAVAIGNANLLKYILWRAFRDPLQQYFRRQRKRHRRLTARCLRAVEKDRVRLAKAYPQDPPKPSP